ncbi:MULTISPECIES: hypothetical protein [unclassified Polaromonas]|uniref:hypothetical protein n=1 Tax=unclassified Polaromonas TaxID=2638319 RepID=UPI0018C9BA3E|nr:MULTISPECIES: hypothetical protein [unclassified Polaromonas]MBG6073964.1 hypothetical protein [Polaromonas sp. CG_9.7]MBG6116012.1 hypothetical protein [Polaromonas sp. CG_9.2]MDH6182920.1 hypothetical protein [Polaromonas sp. CG_23.6]
MPDLAEKTDALDKIVQAAQSQGMRTFRCVATGRDKLDVTFVGFVHMALTVKWRH